MQPAVVKLGTYTAVRGAGVVLVEQFRERERERVSRYDGLLDAGVRNAQTLEATDAVPERAAAIAAHSLAVAAGRDGREFFKALDRVGLNGTVGEKLAVWKRFDTNEDGRLDWAEFQRVASTLRQMGDGASLSLDVGGGGE